MFEIITTKEFDKWLENLRDTKAKKKITARLERVADGNLGQHRNLKGGIFELKIDYADGYRVYGCTRGKITYIMLCGGDKSTQQQDIKQAQNLAKSF